MVDRNGEPRAAAPLTYGAAAARLKANGYVPLSAISSAGDLSVWPVVQYTQHVEALISEHPVAVRIPVLILAPLADQELNERVRAALKREGIVAGLVRIGSDGCEARPVNIIGTLRGHLSALDGAVQLLQSAVVPLDGSWPEGTPLEVAASKSPSIEASAAESLFSNELCYLASRLASDRRPKPRPSRMGWIGRS